MTKLAAGSVLRMVFSRADAGAFQIAVKTLIAPHMSAFDPKRTSITPFQYAGLGRYDALS
jgi:hypothetical protein